MAPVPTDDDTGENTGDDSAPSMNWVMVPVPEEFVDDVMKRMRWNARPPEEKPAVDIDALVPIIEGLDEQARTLIQVLAQSSRNDEQLSVVQTSRAMRCSPREVVGTMVETNQRIAQEGGLSFSLAIQKRPGADDDQPWPERMAIMAAEPLLAAMAETAPGPEQP